MRRRMSESIQPQVSAEDHYEPGFYEIRIKGHLDDQWAGWFGGMILTLEENGNTLLAGPVIDQAALHGLLRRVRDLGMQLISLILVEPDPLDASGGDK